MRKRSFVLAFFIVIYDQIIKYVINNHFYDGKIVSVIDNFLYVTKVHNEGAAWSIFSGKVSMLIVIGILALALLIWMEKKFSNKKYVRIGFGLIYGGLIGNLLDRIIHGYVIDYIKVVIFGYNYPVFNLADIAIVLGFILLIISIFKGEDDEAFRSNR